MIAMRDSNSSCIAMQLRENTGSCPSITVSYWIPSLSREMVVPLTSFRHYARAICCIKLLVIRWLMGLYCAAIITTIIFAYYYSLVKDVLKCLKHQMYFPTEPFSTSYRLLPGDFYLFFLLQTQRGLPISACLKYCFGFSCYL